MGLLLPVLRRNLTARLFALLIAGCAAVSLSGCGSSSASPAGTVTPTTYNFAVNVSAGTTLIQTIQYSVVVQ
jgi:hypothetical protein